MEQTKATAFMGIEGNKRRLVKGMSDFSPQWRYLVLTETFWPCGIGWKFTVDKLWLEDGTGSEVFAFAQVSLYLKDGDGWSEAIPGVGGSKLIVQEKSGPHNSDEAYKMAVTDALSVAMKMLGMAADIYAGLWDGSKYRDVPAKQSTPKKNLPMKCQKNNQTLL